MVTQSLPIHPWNKEFEWRCTSGPFLRLTRNEAASFDREGFLVLRGVFDQETISEVREATDELEAANDRSLAESSGRSGISERGAITFSSHLVTQSALLKNFALNRVFGEVSADLLGQDVTLYWDQAVYKKPEKPRRFPWHQDTGYIFVMPQQYLTCWVPLVDATPENGCPNVAPELHLFGTFRHRYIDSLGWECFAEPPGETIPVPVSAGDIVLFSSLTPHLTGPNITTEVRKAYILQYAVAGTEILRGDPDVGDPVSREVCEDPMLNFAVVRGGSPVSPE
jgi:phytanoyl-CoA hydroxylase